MSSLGCVDAIVVSSLTCSSEGSLILIINSPVSISSKFLDSISIAGIDVMFGFLAPQQRIQTWRQSYARICQVQRKLFGLNSLPFLSYEATFLYQLAVDFRMLPALPSSAPECCRLRRLRDAEQQPDYRAATFCAAFGMLLAGIKLRDDLMDSGHWFNRLAYWKYRGQIAAAQGILEHAAPGLNSTVALVLEQHATLECDAGKSEWDLRQYSKPTAQGFGAVFSAFAATLHPTGDRSIEQRFQDIGKHIGDAIIAWDCAVDYESDRIRGQFNPLQNREGVSHAIDLALLSLAQVGWELTPDATCCDVLIQVSRRLRHRQRQSVSNQPARRMERWGLLRERGFSYARCDGCEGLCSICECAGGGCEAAECCAGAEGCGAVCNLCEGTALCCHGCDGHDDW